MLIEKYTDGPVCFLPCDNGKSAPYQMFWAVAALKIHSYDAATLGQALSDALARAQYHPQSRYQ